MRILLSLLRAPQATKRRPALAVPARQGDAVSATAEGIGDGSCRVARSGGAGVAREGGQAGREGGGRERVGGELGRRWLGAAKAAVRRSGTQAVRRWACPG
jgi:hypothetical protein